MRTLVLLGAVVATGFIAVGARASVITFDTMWPWQVVLNDQGALQTDGYAFTPTAGNANGYIVGGSYQPEGNPQGNQPLVNNGTPNLMCANWVNLNLAPLAGGSFNLTSFEIGGTFNQELAGRWSWASAVQIVGHRADGGPDLTYLYVLSSEFVLELVTLHWTGLSAVDFLPQQNEFGGENDYEFTLDSLAVQTAVTGDVNCDGSVDFADINSFVEYLSNFATWQATYVDCPPQNGDINGDGIYPSFADINSFVALLSGV